MIKNKKAIEKKESCECPEVFPRGKLYVSGTKTPEELEKIKELVNDGSFVYWGDTDGTADLVYFGEIDEEAQANMIKELVLAGKKVVIFYGIPHLGCGLIGQPKC